MKNEIENVEKVKDKIYISYANLAMAHSAVTKKQDQYEKINLIIRAKLLKGLQNGNMNMRTIFDDEKVKLQTGQIKTHFGKAIVKIQDDRHVNPNSKFAIAHPDDIAVRKSIGHLTPELKLLGITHFWVAENGTVLKD